MQKDTLVFDLIKQELQRQRDGIELIASENFTSLDVMAAMGANKIPVHILDYQDQSLSYMWTGNTYYYGGEYLYSNL